MDRSKVDQLLYDTFASFSAWFEEKLKHRKQSASGNLARSFQVEFKRTGIIATDFELFTDSPYYEERETGLCKTVTTERIIEWLEQKNELQDAGLSPGTIEAMAPRISGIINNKQWIIDGTYGRVLKTGGTVRHSTGIGTVARHGFKYYVRRAEDILAQQALDMIDKELLGLKEKVTNIDTNLDIGDI
jgi:hypothetical protein